MLCVSVKIATVTVGKLKKKNSVLDKQFQNHHKQFLKMANLQRQFYNCREKQQFIEISE